MQLSTYFERFRLVEVQESFYDPPTERTLARWRRRAPEGFIFSMRAWQLITHPPTFPGYRRIQRPWDEAACHRFGLLQTTDQTLWAWDIVRRSAEILKAKAIVFQTPPSFTPTRENKGNFARFFASIERGPLHLVWEPAGVWEDEETEALAGECGLIVAVDPLIRKPCAGNVFYCRIRDKTRGRGAHTEDDFFLIHERGATSDEEIEEGFCIWNTQNAAQDAHRFLAWREAV
jgi:uncharacterized protein YecE (DUF72 family)